MTTANVGFVRKEIKAMTPQYNLISDCIAGEPAVKKARTKYLPMPNSDDQSQANISRYNAYIERAVFYNVTQRTLHGMAGQIFSIDPLIEIPKELEYLLESCDGQGVGLVQQSKKAAMSALAYGRFGLFTEYPKTDGEVSKADVENLNLKPVIKPYDPIYVINWNIAVNGSSKYLSLVVIKELYTYTLDGFEIKEDYQWKVLQNIDGVVVSSIYRKKAAIFELVEGPNLIKDFSGASFEKIPFNFIGSENNDPDVDLPPLYDIASLNIAHYRNSADYEESVFITGQPTPYFTGLTEDWVKKVLNGKVTLGARAAIPLPVNSTAGLLQVQENTMPKEAMEQKERQMVSLGAKLVEQKTVQRTATEASMDKVSETSILASIAKNVSKAYEDQLKNCCKFLGLDDSKVKFELNIDFKIANMSPDERRQLISEWQAGAITFDEMRDRLTKGGIATESAIEAKNKIEDEALKELELNMKFNSGEPNV